MYLLQDWIRYGDELRRPLHILPKVSSSSHIAIVGGGLSGLTTAYRIAEKRPDISITLIEKGKSLGGVISTWKDGEWCCDLAVNATRPHPAVWRLVDDIGLGEKFHPSNHAVRRRWIYENGKSHPLNPLTAIKIGPLNILRSINKVRKGGLSVDQLIPNKMIADAMTLGIVNDTAANVDADFLFPRLTRFGRNPVKRWSSIKRKIKQTYPLFTPKRGTVASFEGGMSTLVNQLEKQIGKLPNVKILLNTSFENTGQAADFFGIPESSVIWAAPVNNERPSNKLSVFVIGYKEADVKSVKKGYGTLIPESDIPISGILHESDIHGSRRAPIGHRLFRIMVPHSRWDGDNEEIRQYVRELLSNADPVIFEKIGERTIPSYPPGYLSKISNSDISINRIGWSFSGVSITHVIAEAERVADFFNNKAGGLA